MSLDSAKPSPVPWSVGLVVKNGLKILSTTSGGIPLPLSRMRISTVSGVRCVASHNVGSYSAPLSPSWAVRFCSVA